MKAKGVLSISLSVSLSPPLPLPFPSSFPIGIPDAPSSFNTVFFHITRHFLICDMYRSYLLCCLQCVLPDPQQKLNAARPWVQAVWHMACLRRCPASTGRSVNTCRMNDSPVTCARAHAERKIKLRGSFLSNGLMSLSTSAVLFCAFRYQHGRRAQTLQTQARKQEAPVRALQVSGRAAFCSTRPRK